MTIRPIRSAIAPYGQPLRLRIHFPGRSARSAPRAPGATSWARLEVRSDEGFAVASGAMECKALGQILRRYNEL